MLLGALQFFVCVYLGVAHGSWNMGFYLHCNGVPKYDTFLSRSEYHPCSQEMLLLVSCVG